MSTSDFSDLLRLFEDWEIRYLVVGGYAVMAYTEPRFTKDLDIWIDPMSDNAKKVFTALAQFGAPPSGCTTADFETADMVYQIGVPPIRIDILTSITGVEFADAWVERERRPFQGREVWFISRKHLLVNKQAAGRPRDLIDVEELRLAKRLRPDAPATPPEQWDGPRHPPFFFQSRTSGLRDKGHGATCSLLRVDPGSFLRGRTFRGLTPVEEDGEKRNYLISTSNSK